MVMKNITDKTSTPTKQYQPLSWYVKWASSFFLIIAMILTAYNIYNMEGSFTNNAKCSSSDYICKWYNGIFIKIVP